MKLNYIAYFVVIFSFVAFAMVTLVNDTTTAYSHAGYDLGIGQDNTTSSTYVLLDDVYDDASRLRSDLNTGNQLPDEDSNFFFNFDAIKSGLETLFDSFDFVTKIGSAVSKDFNLPPQVTETISVIIIIGLLGLFINGVVRWKMNN